MNDNQFSAMLAIIVPPIIEQIVKNSMQMRTKLFLNFISLSFTKSLQMKNQNYGITVQ